MKKTDIEQKDRLGLNNMKREIGVMRFPREGVMADGGTESGRTRKNVDFPVGGENVKAYRHGQFQG